MYRKVSDNGQTFVHLEKQIEPPLELPTSFIECPECGTRQLVSCNCIPSNYSCGECNWKHLNHRHTATPWYGENLNNKGMLDKIGRK